LKPARKNFAKKASATNGGLSQFYAEKEHKMTKEERAQEHKAKIARENGSKSKGPVTDAGKAKVSANAVKTGEHIHKLAQFIPPHHAVLCNEDRPQYYQLLKELVEIYQPVNQLALAAVRDIAIARWQIERLHVCITIQWNLALIENANKPSVLAPELCEMQAMGRATDELIGGKSTVHKLNREIAQLQLSVIRTERRLKFIHANFPNAAGKQTQTENPQPTENTPISEPPIYITENTPEVIRAYKEQFPNRKLVILPPDDVANGIDIEDDMPPAPRKAS
jgi:hypothetical protein